MSWAEGTLSDLAFFQRGYDITQQEQRPGPYPVVSSSGVKSFHAEYRVEGPGVVIGRKGTLGTVHYIDSNFWPHDTSLWVKDFKGNLPTFVYYFIHTMDLGRFDVGGANPTLNRNHIHGLPVRIPPLEIQYRIANVLSAYDDLIENNNRRMALLEEAIHLLYREWFVSLRFPGHERVEVVDGVPEGWSRATLSEVCESIEDGDWIESKDQGGEAYRLLQVSNIGVGRFVETGNFRYVTDETFRRLNCREVVAGDVLVSRMPDPIGRAWLVTDMPFKMITAVDVAILKAGAASSPLFLSCHLNSPSSLALAQAKATGATRARISRRVLSASPILVPPEPLVQSFDETVGPLHRQAVLLEKQNQRLREARDLLLPRLMNGSIVV